MLATHVVSQGLAEELKEAGWPQGNSLFIWVGISSPSPKANEPFITSRETNLDEAPVDWVADAPIASELMERMPVSVSIENDERTNKLMVMKLESTWLCQYEFLDSDGDGWGVYADASLPDAIAKLALHLLKENKLNLE